MLHPLVFSQEQQHTGIRVSVNINHTTVGPSHYHRSSRELSVLFKLKLNRVHNPPFVSLTTGKSHRRSRVSCILPLISLSSRAQVAGVCTLHKYMVSQGTEYVVSFSMYWTTCHQPSHPKLAKKITASGVRERALHICSVTSSKRGLVTVCACEHG